ncbi:terpene synthase family protein [Streptomyces syringium]|uniref:Terpene synthase n=1 Tax=Streptomyces syringium TaxID=76729 RepID=A0ABS4XWA7_9ACTN|nr:hypothetical protein [Streptomyces syringium]MBP2400777.1 2-methylisoborneol synthase [Streptomyces syringium]
MPITHAVPGIDRSFPTLCCPPPARVDEVLGRAVNNRLMDWAERTGLPPGAVATLRAADFGRYAMLLHPDTDNPESLLLAARWLVAVFTIDDYCTDDPCLGADPAALAARYALVLPALDHPPLPAEQAPDLAHALAADPMLVTVTSSLAHLALHATPSQIARIRHEYLELLIACATQAAWHHTGHTPALWMYLTSRSLNNFHPATTLIDVVGGYEVPADLYFEPRVRRATLLAATSANMVNDLYSVAKDQAADAGELNCPTVIAASQHCSLAEAIDRTVDVHNTLMRDFETQCLELADIQSPALHRYLTGLQTWVAGNREWHSQSPRYHKTSTPRTPGGVSDSV